MNSARRVVQAQKDGRHVLAVVFGRGAGGKAFTSFLQDLGLRTIQLSEIGEPLSVLEKPAYVFFIVPKTEVFQKTMEWWVDAVETAKRNSSKLVLLASGLSEQQMESLLVVGREANHPILTILHAGSVSLETEMATNFWQHVQRFAFGKERAGRHLVLGAGGNQKASATQIQDYLKSKGLKSSAEIIKNLSLVATKVKHPKKVELSEKVSNHFWKLLLLLLLIVLSPIYLTVLFYVSGSWQLWQARESLLNSQFESAYAESQSAQKQFSRGKGIWTTIEEVTGFRLAIVKSFSDLGNFGNGVGEGIKIGALLGKDSSQLIQGVFVAETSQDLREKIKTIRAEVKELDQQIAAVVALYEESSIKNVLEIGQSLGFEIKGVSRLENEARQIRSSLTEMDRMLLTLPDILGLPQNISEEKKKQINRTYLLVFQNSAELRPTGGFVGSFALLRLVNGNFNGLEFHDVYSADGQLQGRVLPPSEIVHYLGQNSWYMRDANFSTDFPLTAKRLEFFLEKELGIGVDGVVGVDLYTVRNLLQALGQQKITDFNDTVSADNFFQKAEFASEINFFPGSTQKRDFLGAVGKTMINNILINERTSKIGVAQALYKSLKEQGLQLFFNLRDAQEMVEMNNWSGSITRKGCGSQISCFMVVESNFGANKANYFVERYLKLKHVIKSDGVIESFLSVQLFNNSPSNSWPGGNYKNYLRFLLPSTARVLSVSLGDNKNASVSSELSAGVLNQIPRGSFLVYKTEEPSGSLSMSTSSAYLAFGTLVNVPVKQKKEIVIHFEHQPNKNFKLGETYTLSHLLLKQSGTGNDPVDVAVDFPNSWTKIAGPGNLVGDFNLPAGPLAINKRVLYNTDLSTDLNLNYVFSTGRKK